MPYRGMSETEDVKRLTQLLGPKRFSPSRVWRTVGAVVFSVLSASALFLYWHLRQTTKLSANDAVVAADVTNQTGNAVLDDPINLTLGLELSQTRYFSVLSGLGRALTHLQDQMRRMRQEAIPEQVQHLNQMLRGHYAYYGIAGNFRALQRVHPAPHAAFCGSRGGDRPGRPAVASHRDPHSDRATGPKAGWFFTGCDMRDRCLHVQFIKAGTAKEIHN